jgi:hypothetical protein
MWLHRRVTEKCGCAAEIGILVYAIILIPVGAFVFFVLMELLKCLIFKI